MQRYHIDKSVGLRVNFFLVSLRYYLCKLIVADVPTIPRKGRYGFMQMYPVLRAANATGESGARMPA